MKFLLGLLLVSTLLFSQDLDEEFANEFAQEKKTEDFFKSYNVFMTGVNDTIYTNVFTPLAKGYETVIPNDFRVGISNMYENIKFPISFINNILQLKIENSFTELERFVINTTLGFIGFGDVAKETFGIEAKKEDFGQTLGFYGLNHTPHIVLPLLGPSNFRDIIGFGGDYFASPLSYIEGRGNLLANDEESLYLTSHNSFNEFSLFYKNYESMKEDSINLYILLKMPMNKKEIKKFRSRDEKDFSNFNYKFMVNAYFCD